MFDNHSVQFEAGSGCFSYFYQLDLVELETNKLEPFNEGMCLVKVLIASSCWKQCGWGHVGVLLGSGN